jgi:hypothetical protein
MVVSFAIGWSWNRFTRGDNWKFLIGFAMAHPTTRGWIWKGVRWGAPLAWGATKVVAADAAVVAQAAATTRTAAAIGSGATVVAAVGVGYTVGAVTGAVIVSQAEKKEIVYEGATADVLDFYTGEGHYWEQGADDPTPGYFNIPGNASLIAKHYWNKWR